MTLRIFGRQIVAAATAMISAMSVSVAAPKEAVCAMQQAVACGSFEACERALPAAMNLPALMRFNVDKGMIESRLENGDVRTSKIASSSTDKDTLVLQGVDGGHPWAVRVNTQNGRFTLTVLREGEGFLGFGVCSAKILN